jgi:hypothetical protein
MKKQLLLFFLILSIISLLQAQSGLNIFNNSSVHTIKMYTSFPNFWDTMTVRYNESIDLGGSGGMSLGSNDPILFDSIVIDGNKIDSCGVKQKGYYSNWGADTSLKKPLKIEFNEFVRGQRYDGLKEINLANAFQDPTMMHDHLSYKILRDFNLPASRTSYANVYINDDLWSLYVLVEQVGPKFLDEHFGDNNGNLYKAIDSDLKYLGMNDSLYKLQFEKKSNESIDDWSDLINLTKTIRDTHIDTINKIFNVELFLKTLAIDVSLNNWDSYFDAGRNFYLYNDTITKKFQWIPWDYNLAFSKEEYDILLQDTRTRKPLILKCFNNPDWKKKYFDYLCDVNSNIMTLDHIEDFIDDTKTLISTSVANDPNGFYTYNQFDSSIVYNLSEAVEIFPGTWDTFITKGLKPFIVDKQVFILDQFSLEFYTCVDTINTSIPDNYIVSNNMISILPNPSADYIQFITLDGPIADAQMQIISMNGTTIRNEKITNNIIDISTLSNGMYMVHLIINPEASGQIFKGKFLVLH